jgi:hypothetical protein
MAHGPMGLHPCRSLPYAPGGQPGYRTGFLDILPSQLKDLGRRGDLPGKVPP